MLGQQRRSFAGLLCRCERFLRLDFFFYYRLDTFIADRHLHPVHRGIGGQRKEVPRIEWPVKGIDEALVQSHIGDITAHIDRVITRQRAENDGLAIHLDFDTPGEVFCNGRLRAQHAARSERKGEPKTNPY